MGKLAREEQRILKNDLSLKKNRVSINLEFFGLKGFL
jgi:hypothetical protein